MSFKTPKAPAAPATPADPRDTEAQVATTRMRQFYSGKGRASTILTRFLNRGAAPQPRTIVGGG